VVVPVVDAVEPTLKQRLSAAWNVATIEDDGVIGGDREPDAVAPMVVARRRDERSEKVMSDVEEGMYRCPTQRGEPTIEDDVRRDLQQQQQWRRNGCC